LPVDEIRIVLAGPLFNLLIVICCYLSFWFYPESYNFLHEILIANWSIFLFNFLPIYPLDCGRLLLAVFTKKYIRKDALQKTKTLSFIFILFLFTIFLLSFFYSYNFTLGFVCVNLLTLLLSSSIDTSYKRQLFAGRKSKLIQKGLIERTVYVYEDVPLYKLFKFIDDYHYVNFVFLSKKCEPIEKISEIEFYEKSGLL